MPRPVKRKSLSDEEAKVSALMKEPCYKYLVGIISEFVGTGMFFFISCPCTLSKLWPAFYQSFSFGGALFIMSEVCGPFSGGHFNPAISLSTLIQGKIDLFCFSAYMIAQYIGGLLSYSVMRGYLPMDLIQEDWFCGVKPIESTPVESAFIFELLSVAAIALIMCALNDKRNGFPGNSAPMRLGVIYSIYMYIMFNRSGSCFNPVRALFITCYHTWHSYFWIYHLAPYLGGAFAGAFYRFVCDSGEPYSVYSRLVRKRPIFYVDQ